MLKLKTILLLLLFSSAVLSLKFYAHYSDSSDQNSHDQIIGGINKKKFSIKVRSPITDHKISRYRHSFLKHIPSGKTVDLQKAKKLANFLSTPMGKSITKYVGGYVQKFEVWGLNPLNLSRKNFNLAFAMNILSNGDDYMFARSITTDRNLFKEILVKSSLKKH